jgi:hypothetical protein
VPAPKGTTVQPKRRLDGRTCTPAWWPHSAVAQPRDPARLGAQPTRGPTHLVWSVLAPASPARNTEVSTSMERSYSASLLSVVAPAGLCHPAAGPSPMPLLSSLSLLSPGGSGVPLACSTDVLTGRGGLQLGARPPASLARLRRPDSSPRMLGLGLRSGSSSGLGLRSGGGHCPFPDCCCCRCCSGCCCRPAVGPFGSS